MGKRQIIATDQKIDDIIYKLYGLTEEKIAVIVESNNIPSPYRRGWG